jgi:hypothetical protein
MTIALALAGSLLAACGGGDEAAAGDQSAEMACENFRVLAGDVQDGQLTNAEMRSAMQEVEGQASRSDDKELAESARAMVAAITAVDDDRLAAAVADVDEACTAGGY